MQMCDEERIVPQVSEPRRREEPLPERYAGSGENRSPSRIMKIEEIVKWDMNFGVTVGPVGFDHRARCPYCGKRLLLLFHEGGRDRTGIRLAYSCESCGAHSVVSFTPPGQRPELPEITFGERIIVEKPSAIPADSMDAPERPPKRERQAPRSNNAPQQQGNASDSNTPQRNNQQRRNNAPQRQQQQSGAERGENRGQQQRQSRNNSQQQRSAQNAAHRENAPQSAAAERPKRLPQQQQSGHARREDETAQLTEALQERADRAAGKAMPYPKRRKRPYRPHSSGGADNG